MPDAREVELKLEMRPEQAGALLAHPSVEAHRTGEPHTRRLRSVYFDSETLGLKAAGISLRVREVAGGFIQTLKRGERAAGGLFEREEHEIEVASLSLELDSVDPGLRSAVDAALGGTTPVPVFETDMQRVHVGQRDGEDVWELDLDQGHVVAGSARVAISEVELELVDGNPVRLFEAALALLDDFELAPGGLSKAARGYALARGDSPARKLSEELASLAADLDANAPASARAQADALRADAQSVGAGWPPRPVARRMLEAGRLLLARDLG